MAHRMTSSVSSSIASVDMPTEGARFAPQQIIRKLLESSDPCPGSTHSQLRLPLLHACKNCVHDDRSQTRNSLSPALLISCAPHAAAAPIPRREASNASANVERG